MSHSQVGCQPRVLFVVSPILPLCLSASFRSVTAELSSWQLTPVDSPRSTIRSHGAPHLAQQPFALVPAMMQGLMRSGGYVAKCASGYGAVATVQTLRLLRFPVWIMPASPPSPRYPLESTFPST